MVIKSLLLSYGLSGLLIVALISSVLPIPTEPIVFELLDAGENPEIVLTILVIGSIIGALLGYSLGKYGLKKIIPFLARFSYGGAVFIGFLVGMIIGSIAFHYAGNGSKAMCWIAGVISAAIAGALAGGILVGIIGINILAGIGLGAIGGIIGAIVGILH